MVNNGMTGFSLKVLTASHPSDIGSKSSEVLPHPRVSNGSTG